MKTPVNIMDTLTPKPKFDPARKNDSVQFHPIQVINDNVYKRLSQKGVDRTVYTINNKKFGIRIEGTNLNPAVLNSKINIDNN